MPGQWGLRKGADARRKTQFLLAQIALVCAIELENSTQHFRTGGRNEVSRYHPSIRPPSPRLPCPCARSTQQVLPKERVLLQLVDQRIRSGRAGENQCRKPHQLKLDGVPGPSATDMSSSTPAVSTGKVLVVESRARQARNQTRPPSAMQNKLPDMHHEPLNALGRWHAHELEGVQLGGRPRPSLIGRHHALVCPLREQGGPIKIGRYGSGGPPHPVMASMRVRRNRVKRVDVRRIRAVKVGAGWSPRP